MTKKTKRAKLCMIKTQSCKSSEMITDTLQAALAYARANKVFDIEISMTSDTGSWYSNGSSNAPDI